MITIIAKCTVKEDKIQAFKTLAKELVNESKKEEGCLSYELNQDVNNGNILTFIEQWENKEAIDSHNNSAHFKFIVPKLGELQEKESEVNLYEIVI